MSQSKVDAYKKEKAGRRERMEKARKRKKIIRIVIWLTALAIAAVLVSQAAYRHTVSVSKNSQISDVSSNAGAASSSESSGS